MKMTHVLTEVTGVGPSMAEILIANKIDSVRKLAAIDISQLSSIPGIGEVTGKTMIRSAGELAAADDTTSVGGAEKSSKKGKKDKKPKNRKKGKKEKKARKEKKKKK